MTRLGQLISRVAAGGSVSDAQEVIAGVQRLGARAMAKLPYRARGR